MKVILTVAGLSPEFGGPSRSVPALAEALARQNAEVELIACESQAGHSAPVLPNGNLVRTRLLPVRSRQGRWQTGRNDFFRVLCESAGDAETVIHDNGLWLPTNHAAARAAEVLKRPLIISPRGMLSGWSLHHRAWKKQLAWTLFQRRDLERAAALHATSKQEAEEFRAAGLQQPIAIVPNGVEVPTEVADPLARDAQRVRTVLFFSRIHPKKGLLDLVDAWAQVRPSNWRVIVAGNDEGGHQGEVEAAVRRSNLAAIFSFKGVVRDEAKWNLYREADLVALPSHSENFGIVVAEALASAVPVITTRGTPWRELIEHRCGWWEEIGAAPLAEALRAATSLSDEERRGMGQRGRALIEQKYSWRSAASEMQRVYLWLLGNGTRPPCVRGKLNE
ncbi:MAG: glycosyltransferase [Chthoniobacterales bacterium]